LGFVFQTCFIRSVNEFVIPAKAGIQAPLNNLGFRIKCGMTSYPEGIQQIGFVLPMNTNPILVSDLGFRTSSFRPKAGTLGLFFHWPDRITGRTGFSPKFSACGLESVV
jgi:hypothetical protein